MIKIREIYYEETASFGNYQNVKIGATADLETDLVLPLTTLEEALEELKSWVRLKISDRIAKHNSYERNEREVTDKSFELRDLERKIEDAKATWDRVASFLEKHGVDPLEHDSLPF